MGAASTRLPSCWLILERPAASTKTKYSVTCSRARSLPHCRRSTGKRSSTAPAACSGATGCRRSASSSGSLRHRRHASPCLSLSAMAHGISLITILRHTFCPSRKATSIGGRSMMRVWRPAENIKVLPPNPFQHSHQPRCSGVFLLAT